ncbi:hypothetical protein PR202_ga24567 [Eleusine coracana subsp. coracana]|uniref:Gem-associated protein 2 n=1 Tax=Eleusine coracana subsp. coracana TaxID=191504 RepID=A0AAV5D9E3_ELECO|nr:hypothetical protein QOZ80_9AG0677390 [Eleusine coracana subsp. coracana]GJN06803.1 hypothetical protein PR202_ga24567 [Eleusine coracana subsp. coracana]
MDDAAAAERCFKSRAAYTRAEIDALKGFPSAEAQARLWAQVYAALAAAGFAGEYDGLLAVEEPRNRRGNKGKKDAGGSSGRKGPEAAAAVPRFLDVVDNGAWRNGDLGVRDEHPLEAAHESAAAYGEVQEPFDDGANVEYEDDSDDEYEGILKPAFAVDGEPDFESGEPLDGFEYLRRVRWEAKQFPKVKVAKLDLNAARMEQTSYMPEIPEMPKFSPDLRASKEWEDAFLTNFSETRHVFSELDNSDEPSISGVNKILSKPGSSSEHQTEPTPTMLCNLDSVSRAATLRNYIDMIQSLDSLSRNNCLWLFAFCVAVDTPLHAETCASLRSLLRKCATILSTKSEMDDEAVMLNILMTICGKYFGQYEHRYE